MNRSATPVKGLDELIGRIKAEAIEEADRKAAEILSNAEKQAQQILTVAEQRAREIAVSAEREIDKKQAAGARALQRAHRNTVIEARQAILDLFRNTLREESRDVLAGEALATMIETFVLRMAEGVPGSEIDVTLGESESAAYIQQLRQRLQASAGEGIRVQIHPEVSAGFRIGFRDGNFFYEVTPESVAEALSRHLNPELRRLMAEGEGP